MITLHLDSFSTIWEKNENEDKPKKILAKTFGGSGIGLLFWLLFTPAVWKRNIFFGRSVLLYTVFVFSLYPTHGVISRSDE